MNSSKRDVNPVLGFDNAFLSQFSIRTDVDEDEVGIFGQSGVQIIGGDAAKAFGHVVQHCPASSAWVAGSGSATLSSKGSAAVPSTTG